MNELYYDILSYFIAWLAATLLVFPIILPGTSYVEAVKGGVVLQAILVVVALLVGSIYWALMRII